MRSERLLASVLVPAVLGLTACSDGVGHPLDDSESRPADRESALVAANTTLDDVEASVLNGASGTVSEWEAPSGCATNPDSPEQGDVSTILYRTHPRLPAGTTSDAVLKEARTHWEHAGHTVGDGAPNGATQVLTRIDGVGYSVVEAPPGVEARAFLPCFQP